MRCVSAGMPPLGPGLTLDFVQVHIGLRLAERAAAQVNRVRLDQQAARDAHRPRLGGRRAVDQRRQRAGRHRAGGNDADDLAVRERERQPGDALGANAVELQGRVPARRPVPRRVALR